MLSSDYNSAMCFTCRFEYFDLEDFKAALTNPSRDLLARKRILLTPKGREIWAKQEAG